MAILRIHHASVLVESLHRSIAFYQDILGLTQDLSRPDLGYDGAWFSIGEQQIHLLVLPNTHKVTPGLPGGRDFHIAFHVDNLASIQTRLTQSQVPYSLSQSGRKALFCRDPDGNALEFMEIVR